MPVSLIDRYRGCLLGLACGDAVGTTVEFSPRGSFPPVTDMVGGGPFQLEPGRWTDDTSMALCLATSLIHCGGFDARDQMNRYVNWCVRALSQGRAQYSMQFDHYREAAASDSVSLTPA